MMPNLAPALILSLSPAKHDTEKHFLGKVVLWVRQQIRYNQALNELHKLDERLVLLHRLGREARQDLAEVVLADLGVLGHGTRQKAQQRKAELSGKNLGAHGLTAARGSAK